MCEAWRDSLVVASTSKFTGYLPQPSEEIEMCCTVAAALRVLGDQAKYRTAIDAMTRAIEIASDDEAVQQEAIRVNN